MLNLFWLWHSQIQQIFVKDRLPTTGKTTGRANQTNSETGTVFRKTDPGVVNMSLAQKGTELNQYLKKKKMDIQHDKG